MMEITAGGFSRKSNLRSVFMEAILGIFMFLFMLVAYIAIFVGVFALYFLNNRRKNELDVCLFSEC